MPAVDILLWWPWARAREGVALLLPRSVSAPFLLPCSVKISTLPNLTMPNCVRRSWFGHAVPCWMRKSVVLIALGLASRWRVGEKIAVVSVSHVSLALRA